MPEDKKKIGSEVIVDFLTKHGIKHVFDLTGGMIAFIEDAVSRREGIECVPMHHEQAAGFAAEGYSRRGQNFGVALATSGPGATNLITAIGSAYFDSIPCLFIVGQVHTDNIKKHKNVRQEGFQETDIVNVVSTLTKYAVLVKNVDDILYELEKAHYLMTEGRQGSVLVDIPINLQRTAVEHEKHFYGSEEHADMVSKTNKVRVAPHVDDIKKLQDLLQQSAAPLVLVGHGVRLSKTTRELRDFVSKNNLPVVASLLGLDSCVEDKSFVGYIGNNGNRHANIIFANADLIIVLGSRLDVRQTGDAKFFNKQAKIVHVDIDKYSFHYAIPTELSLHTDLKTFFSATKEVVTEAKKPWEIFISHVKQYFARPNVYTKDEINPNTFLDELSHFAEEGATVVADVGQNQMWCAQSWVGKEGQRVLYSGGMGAMGFSLPAAIGAWFADREKQLIVICGDGGLQINIQELETVSRNCIPMKLFIFNNKSLGMVREFQDFYFNKNYQSTVRGYGNPDFKKIAEAYGFTYIHKMTLSEHDEELQKILQIPGPVFIEVAIPSNASLWPRVVYGHALDDQAPHLEENQKKYLEKLKSDLNRSL